MRELSTAEKARILIRVATGEEYGDGTVVSDWADDYVEPGYQLNSDDGCVIFGNWNNTQPWNERERPMTKVESMPERLGEALEAIGADVEWSDEWTTCVECYKALRTQADSYSWKPYGYFGEDMDGYVCARCMRADIESYLPDFIDSPTHCITWARGSDLESIGFVKWEPHNPHTYETGWHEGQTDDPQRIYEQVRREYEDDSVIFMLDESSQFYIRWSVYVRPYDYEPDEEG